MYGWDLGEGERGCTDQICATGNDGRKVRRERQEAVYCFHGLGEDASPG